MVPGPQGCTLRFGKACSRGRRGCSHRTCPLGLHARPARGVAAVSAAPHAAGGRGSHARSPLSAQRGPALDHLPHAGPTQVCGGRQGLTFTGHAVRHDGEARQAGAHGRVPDDPADLLAGPVVCQESGRVSCSVGSDSSRPHGLQPHQASPSLGFSRQDYWSALPCPPPGDLPDPGIEPGSPALQADSLLSARRPPSPAPPAPAYTRRGREPGNPSPDPFHKVSPLCSHPAGVWAPPPSPSPPSSARDAGRRRWGGRSEGCRELSARR